MEDQNLDITEHVPVEQEKGNPIVRSTHEDDHTKHTKLQFETQTAYEKMRVIGAEPMGYHERLSDDQLMQQRQVEERKQTAPKAGEELKPDVQITTD